MVVHPQNKVSKLSTAETKINDSLNTLLADRRFCTLCDMMKIQAIVLAFYGLVFLIAPTIFLIPILGFIEPLPSFWLRALGATLVLAGVLELSIIGNLRRQTSRVWIFMAVPLIFIACTGIERSFGNYQSISLFLLVFEFSMLFLCAITFISFLRLQPDAVNSRTELMSVVGDRAKLETLKMQKYAEKKVRKAARAKQEVAYEIAYDPTQLTKTDPSLPI